MCHIQFQLCSYHITLTISLGLIKKNTNSNDERNASQQHNMEVILRLPNVCKTLLFHSKKTSLSKKTYQIKKHLLFYIIELEEIQNKITYHHYIIFSLGCNETIT